MNDQAPSGAVVGDGDTMVLVAPTTEGEAVQAILNQVAMILGTSDDVIDSFQKGQAHPLAVLHRPVKQVIVMSNPPKVALIGIILPGKTIESLRIAYDFLAVRAQQAEVVTADDQDGQ